ncbi:hypothetical protein CL616_04540 [archaeon]|nr:hypothetical protein [archaeon]|tara:strand:- start:202 stop:516 length:315 start_codon:yes stop_codon:yes gene_type:complete
MHTGHHHIHMRERKDKKPKKVVKFIDNLVLYSGFIALIFISHQIWKIFAFQDASGVSGLAWLIFTIHSLILVSYGCLHKSRNIIITYVLFAILDLVVVVGAFLY